MTSSNISSKQLESAKEALADALEETSVLAGFFQTLKQVSVDGVFPFDQRIMDECDAMVTAMNRLLYEQDGKLNHLRNMLEVKTQVADLVGSMKARKAGKTSQAATVGSIAV